MTKKKIFKKEFLEHLGLDTKKKYFITEIYYILKNKNINFYYNLLDKYESNLTNKKYYYYSRMRKFILINIIKESSKFSKGKVITELII